MMVFYSFLNDICQQVTEIKCVLRIYVKLA